MSKFFDQTQKAQELGSRGESSPSAGIDQILEKVQSVGAVSQELTEMRLAHRRKIHLPRTDNTAINFSGNRSTQIAAESYRTLRTRLMRLKSASGLRSMVVTSSMPGEGKTLTSLNLALCLAQLHDHRVLLVDGDLRTQGLTKLIVSAPGPGLGEALGRQSSFENTIVATDVPNLYVTGAGIGSIAPPELFADNRWREYIGWCSETFHTILVDAPPILPLTDFELISAACDGVLMVVRALHTQRDLIKKASTHIEPKKFLGLVFNAADPGHRNSYYYHYSGNGNGR